SLPLMLQFHAEEWIQSLVLNQWILIGVTVVSCLLLNAEIPLFSLKFKTWDFKSNLKRYLFLLISIVALVLFKFMAIPAIIGLYILMSLFWKD
nr:phosphatidylserine synthase [Bacteroidota bacterium]